MEMFGVDVGHLAHAVCNYKLHLFNADCASTKTGRKTANHVRVSKALAMYKKKGRAK
jgi:hypothetical protein